MNYLKLFEQDNKRTEWGDYKIGDRVEENSKLEMYPLPDSNGDSPEDGVYELQYIPIDKTDIVIKGWDTRSDFDYDDYGDYESDENDNGGDDDDVDREYDNVGDEFFNFNEVDNNNINQFVNDALNGTVTFVECNNLNVPVNNQAILEELTQLNDDLPVNEQVDLLEGILDSIVDNWEETFPGVGLSAAWLQNILKKLPIALLASIFTPKVLLPIFTFKSVCEVKFLCCNARRFILSESLAMVSNTSSHNSGAVYLEK